MWWPALGGIIIGIGGVICPSALGVGYDVIRALLRGELVGSALLLLLAVKRTIWSASLGSGTSGGVLAPLLIMGAALGGFEAHWFPNQGAGFWQVVSMGAILGGTMRSPFMGIVFVLELTHDVNLMLPLLLAVTCAHAFTVLLLKRSILTEKVSRRGYHLTREYETEPLEIIFAREVMVSEVAAVQITLKRSEISQAIDGRRRTQDLLAVVDDAGEMMGIVTGSALKRWAEQLDGVNDSSLESIMQRPVIAYPDEPLRMVINRMASTGLTALPVVDRDNPRKIRGIITLRDMLKARARHLEEEQRRERVLPIHLAVPAFVSIERRQAGAVIGSLFRGVGSD